MHQDAVFPFGKLGCHAHDEGIHTEILQNLLKQDPTNMRFYLIVGAWIRTATWQLRASAIDMMNTVYQGEYSLRGSNLRYFSWKEFSLLGYFFCAPTRLDIPRPLITQSHRHGWTYQGL